MILVYFSQFGQTTYDHFSSVDMQLQPCRRADPVVHDKSDGQEASSIGAIASQPFPCRKGAQVADSAAPLIVGSSSPEASHTSNMQNMQRMGRFQPRPTPPEPNCGGLHAVQSREWAPASSFLRAENAVSLRWAFQNLDLHTQRYYIYISLTYQYISFKIMLNQRSTHPLSSSISQVGRSIDRGWIGLSGEGPFVRAGDGEDVQIDATIPGWGWWQPTRASCQKPPPGTDVLGRAWGAWYVHGVVVLVLCYYVYLYCIMMHYIIVCVCVCVNIYIYYT